MQSNRIYREYETSFACEIAGQERSFRVRKIRRTYNKLNSMAFVAHARPEAPKRLRQGESFDPAPRGKSDTHACSLNKGIGCKSRTRKESVAGLQSVHLRLQARGRIPKVAVFLKYCFPCKVNLARGENRSLEGLSWLREKAEAMRLCEGKFSAHEWISQKTYKPRNDELTAWR